MNRRRNSTAAPMPGVDVMQGFKLSKKEFEDVFLLAAERVEQSQHQPESNENHPGNAQLSRSGRLGRLARKTSHHAVARGRHDKPYTGPNSHDQIVRSMRQDSASRPPTGDRPLTAFRGGASMASVPVPGFSAETPVESEADAPRYADACRRMAASLQKKSPPDYEGAGELFEKAIDARARFGLHITTSNADAHVEYAQNLSKRGLTPEAEYHLRTAADIFRILDARYARKYGDVLLYIAVVIDRQGRLAEAENFYRSALAVYRCNKLSDDNVRVAIDSLSNNLRAQGRSEEVDTVIQRHFLGAPEGMLRGK
jgi:tetratricopeptide (TPR) repeat protein